MPKIPDCPHNDEPMAWLTCPVCQREAKHGSDARPAKRLTSDMATLGATTIAKWDGYCKRGRHRFSRGDEIVLTEDGWTHPECA